MSYELGISDCSSVVCSSVRESALVVDPVIDKCCAAVGQIQFKSVLGFILVNLIIHGDRSFGPTAAIELPQSPPRPKRCANHCTHRAQRKRTATARRSEGRRVGKELVSQCRSRWTSYQ